MNNDLEQFSEEVLKFMIESDHAQTGDVAALARIALAAKQANPVGFIGKQMLIDLAEENRSCGRIWLAERDEVDGNDRIPLYTTSQPAQTEQDGWKLVPEDATLAMLTLLGMTGSFEFMQQKYKNMLAAAPKPESE